jgi:mannose-6-phosphate isomerase
VSAGDFFYIPANTVHAIGGGCSIIEIQQNSDITYRLYDYGRPRELHLDESIAVAKSEPYDPACRRRVPDADITLVSGPHFLLDQVVGLPHTEQAARYRGCLLVVPRSGEACVEDEPVRPGQCALAHSIDDVVFDPHGSCLIAQPCWEQ